MTNNLSKINLIYIASTGRSGSTLLESILGTHSQIINVGEIQVWPRNLVEGGFLPCGCGVNVPDCPFWNQVAEKVNPLTQTSPQIDFFREKYNAGKTLRMSRVKDFFKKVEPSKSLKEKIDIYGDNNYKIFEALLEVAEKETKIRPQWIVDSSKDPYRLLWLISSQRFNIKVIQITKDPRAFVYSMSKEIIKEKPSNLHQKLLKMTVMKSGAWLIQNQLFAQLGKLYLSPLDYKLIQYEQLASEPEKVIPEIADFVGFSFEEKAITEFRNNKNHTIAGNPMRFREGGISLDEAWKVRLPNIYQNLAKLITQVKMSDYGY